MGDVKENMKPTTSKDKTVDLTKKGEKGIFDRFLNRKKSARDNPTQARNFADCLEEADLQLSKLIATKESELNTENGNEEYNRKALSHLKAMEFHLESIVNHAADYSELKH